MHKLRRTKGLFITGTDTDVGKTIVSAALLHFSRAAGLDAVYMKPVQTGCRKQRKKLIAPDLETVCTLADIHPSAKEQQLMVPYRFIKACSPHLAAELARRKIRFPKIMKAFNALKRRHEFIVVEGAGGILTPLSAKQTMLDIMKALSLPVLVVARPGLGTINHTLLTLRELRRAKLKVAGVVINYAANTRKTIIEKNNLKTIELLGNAPVIAELPFMRKTFRHARLARSLQCLVRLSNLSL